MVAVTGKGKPQDYRVLIVDDEPDLLEMLEYDLHRAGYQVSTASGGNEALAKFKENPFDMVITDIRMPQGDGLTLLKNVKSVKADTPVICITGYSEASNSNIIDMGALAVFEKPFDIKKLREILLDTFKITLN